MGEIAADGGTPHAKATVGSPLPTVCLSVNPLAATRPTISLTALADSGSGRNCIGASRLAALQRAGAAVRIAPLTPPSTAELADNTTPIVFTHVAHMRATFPAESTPTDISFHVFADDNATYHPGTPDALLGWDALRAHRILTFNPAAIAATASGGDTRTQVAAVPSAPPASRAPDLIQPHVAPWDKKLFPPPTDAQLAERARVNRDEYEKLMRRVDDSEKEFVEPPTFQRFRAVFKRLEPHFREVLERGDQVRDVHVPWEELAVPSDKLPRIPFRQLTPHKQRLVNEWVGDMLDRGFLVPVDIAASPTAAPAFPTGPAAKPRVVCDTSAFTDIVEHIDMHALTPEQKSAQFAGMQCAASLDMPAAYYQIPINEHTPLAVRLASANSQVFCFKVLLMGAPNSAAILTDVLNQILGPRVHDRFVNTADDIAVLGKGANVASGQLALVVALEELELRIVRHNVTLKASKTTPYTTEVDFCGLHVTPKGVTKNPNSVDAIKDLTPVTTMDRVYSLHSGASWCRTHIPQFAATFADIHDALERAFHDTGNKRTKISLTRLDVADYGLTPARVSAITDALHHMAVVAHRDKSKALVLITDAAAKGPDSMRRGAGGGTLFQVPREHVANNRWMELGTGEAIGFHGRRFNHAQLNQYPVHELEALAVVLCLRTFQHLIDADDDLLILVDNVAVTFIFDPRSAYIKGKAAPGKDRLLRWCAELRLLLSHLRRRHRMLHLAGHNNHLSDEISRSPLHAVTPPDDFHDDDFDFDATA